MSTVACAMTHGADPDLPDAGGGMCCYGAALYGPARCTCWRAEYDLEQQPVRPGLPLPPIPVRLCQDCAYRANSPERQGDAGYQGDADELDALVASGQPFFCHRGIRRPVRWRHPSGAVIDGHPAGYEPPIADGVPYKADGSPADICAGWMLRRVKEVQK